MSCEDLDANPFFCDYYGELSRQIPIVAFSVSSQSCPYYKMSEQEKEKMGRYLNNFKKITVRDQWTKQMVESVSGLGGIQITPDPVFAFNQNCYIQIPTKEELFTRYSLPDHYALFSFPKGVLPEIYIQEIGTLLQKKGIEPVALAEPEGVGYDLFSRKVDLPLNPIDWYALIKNSDAYIGTRMHPIIVCLHNAVPFFSYDGNGTLDIHGSFNKTSSKIYDILALAGLDKNTYALNSREKVPNVDTVKNQLIFFNREKCQVFSNTMEQLYTKEISSLLLNI